MMNKYTTANCWQGRGGKLLRILGKNKIFNEHPVYDIANGRKILGIG